MIYLSAMNWILSNKWMLWLGLGIMLALVIAFSLPKKQGGGSCGCSPLSENQAIVEADLIFKGTCTYATTNWIAGGMKYSFAVEEAWKRRSDSHMIVNSGWEPDCGYRFEPGKTYLVFANKKFSLQTNRCAGTRVFEAEDSIYLSLKTMEEAPIIASPMVARMIWTIGILGVLSIVFVAFVVLRKKKFSRS